MNVRTIAATLVFSLVISQHVVSMAQPPQRGKMRNLAPSASASSPLGLEIQRYLAQLRQASLDRAFRHAPPPTWFDSWDETDPWFPGGLAISLAEIDGHFEIEAALADPQGQQKLRASGSREEIDAWVMELPARLCKAIQRHLGELDGAAEQPCDDPLEEPQPNLAPRTQ